MAGFGVFRTYQKASMVALAILAMLAFFVLPPLLQYGGQAASLADTPVATWNGGEVREKGLDRAVMMKFVVNRFLQEAAMAAGRDPAQATRFDVDERSVVTMMLLAEEAKKNGIVVSDAAINDFLAKETNGQVGADQFEQIMGGLRAGGGGVSQHDLFEAMRQELLAQNMLLLLQRGLFGNPPGLRWDYFRRLTQSATAEVVPVDVRSVSAKVDLPSAAVLKAFFEKHKEDLPDPRSEKPGFREPHRAEVEYLVAKRGAFVDEISKQITDADIAEYYEKNKTTQFRARPGASAAVPAAPAEPSEPAEGAPATEPAPVAESPQAPAEGTPPAAEPAPASEQTAPAAEPAPASEPTAPPAAEPAPASEPTAPPAAEPAPATEPAPVEKPAEGGGAAVARSPFRQVAYQADAPATETPPAADEAAAPASEPPAAPAAPAADAAPDGISANAAEEQFEPLEAVSERIREQLAAQRANARIDNIFDKLALDLSGYAEDLARWQADGKVQGQKAPLPPDISVIAKVQGLEGGQTGLQSAEDAFDAGGLGRSFEFIRDQSSRFGMRQLNWVEMIYGPGGLNHRALRSRDMEGTRYLSWRTADQPEFVPTFDTARANVEQAWKIVEGRGLARKKAEEIMAKGAKAESLEAAIAGDESLQAFKVGPFFWLSPQAAASGVPQISQPAGVVMPGHDFMSAVFSLQPGGTAVAFNEPKTVCYCIRLIDVEPAAETLKERFIETRSDPRTTMVAAQDEIRRSFGAWFEGLEARSNLEWKRQPRR